MNRILLLIAYRCYDQKTENYSGEFFQTDESLARTFKLSRKQINTVIQMLVLNDWISISNQGSKYRRIKLTNKTKELIYLETESILENPNILPGTKGYSNCNQNFQELGTKGYSNCNQNVTQKRTRKEPLKELSKMERENFEKIKIVASGGPEFIRSIKETGLMEKFKEMISEAGPHLEKESESILFHFGGLDSNKGKGFAPDEMIQRFKGYLKKGFYFNKPQIQTTTKAKGGILIG